MLKKILIALGDEVDAELVVKSGLALAEKFASQVMLLHVIEPYLSIGYSPMVGGMFPLAEPFGTTIVNDTAISLYESELKQHERDSLERLQAYATQAANSNMAIEISQHFGNPGRTICELANNWQADTIVMGRNQQSALSEMFLGSTSNYVLHHAPCSVLVVRLPTSNDSGDEKPQP